MARGAGKYSNSRRSRGIERHVAPHHNASWRNKSRSITELPSELMVVMAVMHENAAPCKQSREGTVEVQHTQPCACASKGAAKRHKRAEARQKRGMIKAPRGRTKSIAKRIKLLLDGSGLLRRPQSTPKPNMRMIKV